VIHFHRKRLLRAILILGLLPGILTTVTSDLWSEQPESFEKLGAQYDAPIRPLLDTYCFGCHSTQKPEGDLDLESLNSLTVARRNPRVWQKVLLVLENAEMPPEKSKQLSADELATLKAWVRTYLNAEAHANAGDPGRVVVRRLSNAEYDNTIRDLTGVDFQPTREFPADSAAGEGFTNAGESMVMSPALFEKYLAAAEEVAAHAVLLPDGFRFSKESARRDQADEVIDKILALYEQKTDVVELRMTGGNRDGRIRWGQVPLTPYVQALIQHREKLKVATSDQVQAIARAEALNPVYLGHLLDLLSDHELSPLLAQLQGLLRKTTASDAAAVERETATIIDWIARWQHQLLTLEDVGQLFTPGQQPLDPMTTSQKIRLDLGSDSSDLSLVAHGSGAERVVWKNARLENAELGSVPLRDAGRWYNEVSEFRKQTFLRTADYLATVAEAASSTSSAESLAKKHELNSDVLLAWCDYLNVSLGSESLGPEVLTRVSGLITDKKNSVAGFAWVKGWGAEPPNLIASSSDTETANVPGEVPPRSIGVHPSPTHYVGVGWKSPIVGAVKIEAQVIDRHAGGGNGVEWFIVAQRGNRQKTLAGGVVEEGQALKVPPMENQPVREGDILSLRIGPRDANHICDQTQIKLVITEQDGNSRIWDLGKDVSADLHAGNPHADSLGNENVWHFYTDKIASNALAKVEIPEDSVLARWRLAIDSGKTAQAARHAQEAATLFASGPIEGTREPDRQLYRQTRAVGSPLFKRFDREALEKVGTEPQGDSAQPRGQASDIGIDPATFKGNDLVIKAPGTIHITFPLEFATGWSFAVTAELAQDATGFVQVDVAGDTRATQSGLQPGLPILVREGHPTAKRLQTALDDFRGLFPRAMCCRTIVPIDKVITLVMYHREDEHFRRLLLTEAEQKRLDRLWQEVRYISQDALRIHEYYPLFLEFSTQGDDTHVFLPLKEPIRQRAEAFTQHLEETAPAQVDALINFAARAFRRGSLEQQEASNLRAMYANLRAQEEGHDAAFRGVLARVLVSPSFLYRIEEPGPRKEAGAVTDTELATRLSYFLWSTMPDSELLAAAKNKTLNEPDTLVAEARRMLEDERVRGLATEFACQWLGIRTFSSHNEKNEKEYPTFTDVRDDMFEESVRFFEDLFRRNGSVLEILDADHTFMNESLAKHYEFSGVTGDNWQRIDGLKQRSRGGVLGMGAILAKQSGATRTSPVLRGNWVVETLLGEKLPDPPATVPKLPDALSLEGLTVRQMTERHVSDPSCASCHVRIDPFGFALESFDAIGRFRDKDLNGMRVDTQVQLKDGTRFEGIDGLRSYLLMERRDDFLEQFCRKLLGFAVGRTVELTDQPLVDEMVTQLKQNDYRISAAIETILRSKQFRFHRGLESTHEEPI